MGNEVCCDDVRGAELPIQAPTIPALSHSSNIQRPQSVNIPVEVPPLSQAIKDHLDYNKPFQNELPSNPIKKRFGDDVYEGLLDSNGKPEGYGKMYKRDGSLFIGNFQRGIASGRGTYIFPNGAFYKGEMRGNEAETIHGQYYSDDIEYKGGFKVNKFHGNGKQKGKKHQFQGSYHLGKRVKGVFKWDTVPNNDVYEYVYTGEFDQEGKFSGRGNLQQIKGRYEGEFKHGEKHGRGEYLFNTKVKYVGDYVNGLKEGEGTLYNDDNTVCYSGQWKNGLPNGRGYIIDKKGMKVQSEWRDGVDAKVIEEQ